MVDCSYRKERKVVVVPGHRKRTREGREDRKRVSDSNGCRRSLNRRAIESNSYNRRIECSLGARNVRRCHRWAGQRGRDSDRDSDDDVT
jgi:hypothetical protein